MAEHRWTIRDYLQGADSTGEFRAIQRAKDAYEAYCKATGGVSLVSGDRLPHWDNLSPQIQAAWRASADFTAGKTIELCSVLFPDLLKWSLGLKGFR